MEFSGIVSGSMPFDSLPSCLSLRPLMVVFFIIILSRPLFSEQKDVLLRRIIYANEF